jgi:hypothetical protein
MSLATERRKAYRLSCVWPEVHDVLSNVGHWAIIPPGVGP